MVVPGRGGGEAGGADLARVRLLPCMRTSVVDQRRLLSELALAVWTLEWLLTFLGGLISF